jgi:Sec-independent protein translocase protein TatA
MPIEMIAFLVIVAIVAFVLWGPPKKGPGG